MSTFNQTAKSFARDCVLIILSILAALAVNEWRVIAKERAELRAAVLDLSSEIADNLAVLDGVPDYQRRLSGLIAEAAEVEISEQTPMALLAPVAKVASEDSNSFLGINGVFQSVSWDMAKDRGVVSRMNYDTAKKVAFVNDQLLPGLYEFNIALANRMTSADLHKPEDQKPFLMELSGRFAEAGSRAQYVEEFLIDAQKALQEDYPNLLGEAP